MFDFLCTVFFAIGFTLSMAGVGYGLACLFDKIQMISKESEERSKRLLTALERIEANTRNKSNQD